MRKIEKEMIEAIQNKKKWRKDNTEVHTSKEDTSDLIQVYLHGHRIANIYIDKIYIIDCGYQTKTTKSRLNCILSHYNLPTIYSKKYQWFIGDEEWTGDRTFERKNF